MLHLLSLQSVDQKEQRAKPGNLLKSDALSPPLRPHYHHPPTLHQHFLPQSQPSAPSTNPKSCHNSSSDSPLQQQNSAQLHPPPPRCKRPSVQFSPHYVVHFQRPTLSPVYLCKKDKRVLTRKLQSGTFTLSTPLTTYKTGFVACVRACVCVCVILRKYVKDSEGACIISK